MSTDAPLAPGRLHHLGLHELRKRCGWYLALGILLVISGMVAISFSLLATVFSVIFIGCQLILAGVVLMAFAFSVKQWGGFFLDLLMGVLYVVAGIICVANPAESAVALTLLIAMFLMFGGIFRIVISLMERFPHWGWVVLSGVVNLLLGIAIWWQWPLSGLWVIGLFVGIEMIFNGWSLVMLSMAAKNIPTGEPAAAQA